MSGKDSEQATHLQYAFEQYVNFTRRSITISEDIGDDTFAWFDAAMTELETRSRKTVTIKINSHGGCVYEAMAIVGRMRASSCYIVTVGFGAVFSAACLILAAGHKRKISPYSWFMTHEMRSAVDGTTSQIADFAAQMMREDAAWGKWMANFSYEDEGFWIEAVRNKETYYTAAELKRFGVVDEVLNE